MTIPQPYNLTLAGNVTGYVELMTGVNDHIMGGWFGVLFLITLFVIVLLSLLAVTGGSIAKSFASTSFIIFALSLLFRILGLVPDIAMYSMLGIAAISLAFINPRE